MYEGNCNRFRFKKRKITLKAWESADIVAGM